MSLQALRRWIARHPLSWVLGLALALGGAQFAATAHAYTHVASAASSHDDPARERRARLPHLPAGGRPSAAPHRHRPRSSWSRLQAVAPTAQPITRVFTPRVALPYASRSAHPRLRSAPPDAIDPLPALRAQRSHRTTAGLVRHPVRTPSIPRRAALPRLHASTIPTPACARRAARASRGDQFMFQQPTAVAAAPCADVQRSRWGSRGAFARCRSVTVAVIHCPDDRHVPVDCRLHRRSRLQKAACSGCRRLCRPHPLATTASAPNVAGGDAQRFVEGSDVSGDWWTLFHSRPLNALIEQSLANNPDLKAAQAALSQAQGKRAGATRFSYYPSVSASVRGQSPEDARAHLAHRRTRAPSCTACSRPQVSISYSLDPFGPESTHRGVRPRHRRKRCVSR